eukprot:scaffold10559_cov77-Phaeocystis_antarctica.AAC.1
MNMTYTHGTGHKKPTRESARGGLLYTPLNILSVRPTKTYEFVPHFGASMKCVPRPTRLGERRLAAVASGVFPLFNTLDLTSEDLDDQEQVCTTNTACSALL